MNLDSYISWETAPSLFATVVYLGVGATLVAVARRTLWLWAFGAYCILFAATYVTNILGDFGATTSIQQLGGQWVLSLLVLTFAALVAFLLNYPRPRLGTRARRLVTLTVLVGCLALAIVNLVPGLEAIRQDEAGITVRPHFITAQFALAGTGVVAFIVSRDLRASHAVNEQRSIWLVVLGFCLYPIYRGVRAAYFLAEPSDVVSGGIWADVAESLQILVVPLALVAAWRLGTTVKTQSGRWGVVLAVATSILLGILTAEEVLHRSVTLGVVPLVLPVVVAYALLRLEFAGLDRSVRWTVSKGTIAGVLVLAFLVGSQIVQNVTATKWGAWGGAIAAGGALFAVQPIARIADRFANAAIPVVVSSPARPPAGSNDETYKAAVRKFLADGAMSRDDERHLARLTASLGIDAARAFDLRDEVESEPVARSKGKTSATRRRSRKAA